MIRIILSVLVVTCYINALVIDPCSKLKCKKPDMTCADKTTGTCKCARQCKKQPDNTQSNFYTSKFGNITLRFDSRVVPLAKQGGVSCYQSACMNGGTCYTNYNAYTTQQATTTTTTSAPVMPPLCSCQAQFSGSRCELFNQGNTVPQEQGWNNLCRVYNDKNMNVCQNGGQCVYISDNKVACVCPSTFVGQYCEIPVYEQCNGPARAQCHREHGTCSPDGQCQCDQNYSGPKCENRVSIPVQPVYTTAPTQPATQTCLSYYCQNGGTCRPINVDPYVMCICPPSYTGSRCEIYVAPPTLPQTPPPTVVTQPQSPCQTQQYCVNGGTCQQTNYAPFAYCLCPIGYTGTRCEICTTQPPTMPPTPPPTQPTLPPAPPSPCQTQQFCLNGGTCQPTSYAPYAYCLCPIGYTGTRCEICTTQPPTMPPTPPPTQPQSPCLTQQFCLNGGTCRATNYSPYAYCICPPNYTGTRCEICVSVPVTIPTQPPTQPQSPCLTQQYCLNGGTCRATNNSPYAYCMCPPNYTGSRCEICVSVPVPPAPVAPSPSCLSYYCQNGGSCQSMGVDPYISCRCPPNYTGARCEICLSGSGSGSIVVPHAFTSMPRCNFTVSLKNEGGLIARFTLMYNIDGITQPLLISNQILLGQTASLTISYYARDLVVIAERQSGGWQTIFTDSGIDIATKCTKCYKVWGVSTSPRWDHLLC